MTNNLPYCKEEEKKIDVPAFAIDKTLSQNRTFI